MAALSLVLILAAAPATPPRVAIAQLTIRRSLIVRIPAQASAAEPARRIRWKEKKGPRCTSMDLVAGAVVAAPDSVDLILRGGERLRAEFAASCPALAYYSGFYIMPTADRRICADRDAVHDRSGGECAIERFRRLVAVEASSSRATPLNRIRAAPPRP